ncbi:MAG: PAS domain S-box protein [Candidatus Eremiobacterota bacterium]
METHYKNEIRILSQLLSAQGILYIFPTLEKIGEFGVNVIKSISGVMQCSICLVNHEKPLGDIFEGTENLSAALKNGSEEDCKFLLPLEENLLVFYLQTISHFFGYVLVSVSNPHEFELFRPAVSNFINIIAIHIENTWQKTQIELYKEHLEDQVKKRTDELLVEIAERERVQEELISSEALLNATLDSIPDIIGIQNIDHTILRYNQAGYKFLNLTPEKVHGKRCYELMGRGEICENCASEKAMKTMMLEQVEIYIPEYDIYLDCRSNPVFNEKGEVVFIVEQLRDITERKHAEENMRKSEVHYRTILQTALDGFCVIDLEGHFIDVNEAYCNMAGYSRDELLEMTLNDVEFQEGKEEILRHIKKVIENGSDRFESRHRSKDGQIIELDISVNCLPGEGRLFVFLRDITGQKMAHDKQKKLQEQLSQAQKMESVGRLAGGVAHDFNNILGIILSCVELSLDQVTCKDPVFDNLVRVRNAVERSANLVRQLLAFARKQIITPVVLNLNDTVEDMLKMLRRLIGEDIDLIWKPSSGLKQVMVDPSQIDQILANLLVNARDAIDGVGRVTVGTGNAVFDEVYCSEHPGFMPGDYVRLSVSDNGCGMDSATLANIFEPFFTTKRSGKGTGLGLATVYGIVRQNNGFITVYSEPSLGSTFNIYLPQYTDKTTLDQAKEQAETIAGGKETVMLVEDEPMLLEGAKAIVKKLGYTVLTAITPFEAMSLAEKYDGEIHLLITDVIMPEMNGRELADRLMSLYPDLRCLFMSGYTADVIAHHGILDKGVHFIQKPFSIKDLAKSVRKALE